MVDGVDVHTKTHHVGAGVLGRALPRGQARLRALAQRIEAFDEEIADADRELAWLVIVAAPTLSSKTGIGHGPVAQLFITAEENIGRLHSQAAFARLCGVAPIPVSSSKTRGTRQH